MNYKKKLFLFIVLLLIIAVGFLRDFIFISINEKTGQGLTAAHKGFFILKWVLTFGFSFFYLGLSCLVIHRLFERRGYLWIVVFLYAVLFGVSLLIALGGMIFASFEKVYSFTRTIMGITQSPVPLMVLIPFCLLNEKIKE